MVVEGSGLQDQKVNYTVCKLGLGGVCWWWATKETIENSFRISPYKPNATGEYSFEAIVSGFKKTSEKVTISEFSAQDNSLPVAVITAPADGFEVSAGTNINFNQSSYDDDDLLKITWDFGDGTPTQTITNYVNPEKNPSVIGSPDFNTTANAVHNYSSSGPHIVTLTAEEMERGQKDSTEITVNVFSRGINVFPVISSPKEGIIYASKTINFDAGESYVLNCTASPCPGCPKKIENGKLNCSYLHHSSVSRSGYNLFLKWTIEGKEISKGNWFDDSGNENTNVTNFYKYFFKPQERTVKLYMKYNPGQ
jgi:hypothetical protein